MNDKQTAPMMPLEQLHEQIRQAADAGKVLRITYTNVKDEVQTRNVEPYEVRGDKLWAYCRKKKGIRQFQLDRISTAKPTQHSYFPKWPVKIGEGPLNKNAAFWHNDWHYRILEPLFGPYQNAELE